MPSAISFTSTLSPTATINTAHSSEGPKPGTDLISANGGIKLQSYLFFFTAFFAFLSTGGLAMTRPFRSWLTMSKAYSRPRTETILEPSPSRVLRLPSLGTASGLDSRAIGRDPASRQFGPRNGLGGSPTCTDRGAGVEETL